MHSHIEDRPGMHPHIEESPGMHPAIKDNPGIKDNISIINHPQINSNTLK
jgi:hypothetical protein